MHTYSGYNAPLILLSYTAGWHEAEGSYVSHDLSEGKQTCSQLYFLYLTAILLGEFKNAVIYCAHGCNSIEVTHL